MMAVSVVSVGTGMERQFESVLRELRTSDSGAEDAGTPVWYELIAGGPKSRYVRITPLDSWAELQEKRALHKRIAAEFGGDRQARLLDQLSASVLSVKSELWSFRPDLTYRPE